MPYPKTSDRLLKEAMDAVDKHGSISGAARALGMNRSTFEGRYRNAVTRFEAGLLIPEPEEEPSNLELPTFPDDDIEANEILDHLSKRFEMKSAAEASKHWFEVNIKTDDPFGLAVVGDPHLGSDTNIPLLRRDVDILANTKGIGAVNIGDTANNWGGRLIHLYSQDDVSKPTERRLARWFLQDAGVPWILWLHGNHESMHTEFSTYLESVNTAQIPMIDWRARFKLVFPSSEIKVDAAHNHKGTSIYNPLQGQKRASLWDEDADIYVAGHHHTWALTQEEQPGGRVITMGRARGYKWLDDYARRGGFRQDSFGATILFVIDPKAGPNTKVKPFSDLGEGAEFLTWKRARSN